MIRIVLNFFLLLPGACVAATSGALPLPFESYGSGAFISRAKGLSLLVNHEQAALALPGGSTIRMRVVGANPLGRTEAEEPLTSFANYLIGRDPAAWRINVPQFGRIRVKAILPGVDILYYGNRNRLEYDLILQPMVDVASIRLRFEGAEGKPRIDGSGDLVFQTAVGEIVEHRPRIQQDGKPVDVRYRIDANGDVYFKLGHYDRRHELRIDPVISYLTYLGGTSDDSPNAIALDTAGNAYIAGSTSSFIFPVTTGALQTTFPPTTETVAFVTKLNAAGTGLVYTTFWVVRESMAAMLPMPLQSTRAAMCM